MADNDPKIYNTPGTTKSKSKSSFVWEHFGFYKINGVLDKTRSICKICTKDYAYSGKELFFFKQVEAQPNEEATGSSSTPLSQSGQNKDDDWLGDVFIVKEEKANPDDKLDSEIETFCNTTNITREEDSLKWWAERESLFPCLSWVAKKYLAIPASSVPSERIFSLAGNIVSKKRACLKPENVDMLIFLKKSQ